MLEVAIANELAAGTAGDVAARIDRVVTNFLDPDHLAIDQDQWLVVSLRRTIHYQGGPATGEMVRLDRNIGSPGDHRIQGANPIMPG